MTLDLRLDPFAMAAAFSVTLLGLVVVFLVITTYNDVIALILRIDKAWANIDVALRQRHDELPNLVAAVRDVMAFEQDVLEEVARRRAAYSPEAPIPEQAATSEATSSAIRQLFAVVERYPELHSHRNVLDLQAEIARLEELIADRRELYNDSVYRYNTRISQMPGLLVAGLFRWSPRPFFAADPADLARPDTELRPA